MRDCRTEFSKVTSFMGSCGFAAGSEPIRVYCSGAGVVHAPATGRTPKGSPVVRFPGTHVVPKELEPGMNKTEELRKPILPGQGASDYERYLRTDELLALQKKTEALLHPDEMTFQVVHQASELLMKGAAFELERAL